MILRAGAHRGGVLRAAHDGHLRARAFQGYPRQARRDAHLKTADFLDVEHHPEIRYRGRGGQRTGAGFVARTTLNRHDFGVSWNSALDQGCVVGGDEIEITIDAEAILET